jgi:hypothetical protein
MERAMLWFKCAAVHDPVRPVVKKPAVIGWEAKQRQVDLVIERSFEGDELLSRMKGWVTADVNKVTEIVRQHGQLKTLDDYDLVVETRDKSLWRGGLDRADCQKRTQLASLLPLK